MNSESTLENVEELFGNPSESDNMLAYEFTTGEKGIEYFGEDTVWIYFGYTDKLKVYIPNSIILLIVLEIMIIWKRMIAKNKTDCNICKW